VEPEGRALSAPPLSVGTPGDRYRHGVGSERILVTGSAGHLGEGVVRVLRAAGRDAVGLDILESPFTSIVGSVADRDVVRRSLAGVTGVVHTATLHKPHIGSHERSDFVETNVSGTLALLEEAVAAGVASFVFTSTTSAFGRALYPGTGAPAAWITEDVVSLPRNIYGVTKAAAEDICELVARDTGLPVIVLRTSRFFPESDDRDDVRAAFDDGNLKANELLYRRVDLEDVVGAHLLALERAPEIGFAKYIVSATTPFRREDAEALAVDAASVVRALYPDVAAEYARRGWRLLPSLDRVYVNERARRELGWSPRYDFRFALERLKAGEDPRSELARAVGAKGYHAVTTGPYTVR
jgi:nucleoside-diphosphate-sugar epimerase